MAWKTSARGAGCAGLIWLCACGAAAQGYPSRPVNIVVPYEPGGTSDIVVRVVQPRLNTLLGQPVTVENRPGAGGLTGTEYVAKMPPDGYTALGIFDSFVAVPFLYDDVHHDPVKDFAPVSLMVRAPQVLIVHPGLGIKTVDQLLALAKTQGSALAFSTAGPGSSSRLVMERLKLVAKIDPTLVSYKGGGPALSAVLGGHVAGFLSSIGTVFPTVKAGKVVPIAVSSKGRNRLLPGVPALDETFPGFEAQSWVGISLPAATPRSVVMRLNDAISKALMTPDIREKFESQGMEVVASTPEVYGEWIREQVQTWGPVIKSLNIKVN